MAREAIAYHSLEDHGHIELGLARHLVDTINDLFLALDVFVDGLEVVLRNTGKRSSGVEDSNELLFVLGRNRGVCGTLTEVGR